MATYQKHQPNLANEAAQKQSPVKRAPVQPIPAALTEPSSSLNLQRTFMKSWQCCGPAGFLPFGKYNWISLLLILTFLSACGGAPAATQIPSPVAAPTQPPATPTVQPSATPLPPTPTAVPSPTPAPTVSAGGLKPLDSAACGELAKVMGQTLGVETATAEAPFQDYVTGQAGTGCQTVVTGAGWDFVAVTKSLWAMLAAQGWQEDTIYDADGPTGAIRGFRQGDGLCLLAVEWKPSPDANCPSDKPISDCQLKPEQRLYNISLNCARGASSQP
jgi:uncharacterized protein (DUF2237 family)